jgi:hypothetical protein
MAYVTVQSGLVGVNRAAGRAHAEVKAKPRPRAVPNREKPALWLQIWDRRG